MKIQIFIKINKYSLFKLFQVGAKKRKWRKNFDLRKYNSNLIKYTCI